MSDPIDIVYTVTHAKAEQVDHAGTLAGRHGAPDVHYNPGDWIVTEEATGVAEWYTNTDFRRIFGPRNPGRISPSSPLGISELSKELERFEIAYRCGIPRHIEPISRAAVQQARAILITAEIDRLKQAGAAKGNSCKLCGAPFTNINGMSSTNCDCARQRPAELAEAQKRWDESRPPSNLRAPSPPLGPPPGPSVPPRVKCVNCRHTYADHRTACTVPGCECKAYRDGVMG